MMNARIVKSVQMITGPDMATSTMQPHQFLDYLASDEAQNYFANGNNEFAVVEGVTDGNRAFEIYGDFKTDDLNVSAFGENQAMAVTVFELAGWQ